MITQKNYEIYFADYLDGTLGEAETAELKAFLLVHPELSKLIEDTDKVKLQKPTFTYLHKESLKKNRTTGMSGLLCYCSRRRNIDRKGKKAIEGKIC